jgi:hypothetical protein
MARSLRAALYVLVMCIVWNDVAAAMQPLVEVEVDAVNSALPTVRLIEFILVENVSSLTRLMCVTQISPTHVEYPSHAPPFEADTAVRDGAFTPI